jgi:chromosome segregation ATPase
LNRANESRDEFEHKCKSLESQVGLLQEEKQSLMSDINILQNKLHENESNTDNDEKLVKLQLKIDLMQEDLYKLDACNSLSNCLSYSNLFCQIKCFCFVYLSKRRISHQI